MGTTYFVPKRTPGHPPLKGLGMLWTGSPNGATGRRKDMINSQWAVAPVDDVCRVQVHSGQ